MIYTPQNSKGLMLVDARGTIVPGVFEFNDETCEAKFFILGRNADSTKINRVVLSLLSVESENYEAEVIKASAVIKGAKMVPRYPVETDETRAAEDRVAAATLKILET